MGILDQIEKGLPPEDNCDDESRPLDTYEAIGRRKEIEDMLANLGPADLPIYRNLTRPKK